MDFNILAPPLRDFLCLACRAHRLACQFPDFLLCAEESLSRGARLIRSLVQFIHRQDANLCKILINSLVYSFL